MTQPEQSPNQIEAMLSALIALSPIGFGFSKDGVIINANQACLGMFGYGSLDEIPNPSLLNMVAPHCRKEFADRIKKSAQGHSVASTFETTGLHKAGSEFPVLISENLVETPDGFLTLTFLLDLSEQKLNEIKFRSLFDTTRDAVMLLDERGFLDCNSATLDLFGCTSRDEFCLKHPADLSPPLQAGDISSQVLADQHIARAMNDGSHHFNWVHRRADNGKDFSAEVKLSSMKLNGKPVLQASVCDISERENAKAALMQKERYQRALLDTFPYAVWLKDTESNFLSVNEGFARIFGAKSADELIGKNDFDIAPRELAESYRADDKEVRDARQKKYIEELIETGGERKWFETHKAPVIDVNGNLLGTVGFARDITDRKLWEEALRASEENANNLASMLRLISDNVPDMIWAKDLDNRYVFTNKAICRYLLNATDTNEPIGKNDMFFAQRERERHPDNPQWHTFGEICRDTDTLTLDHGKPAQFEEYGNVQGKFLFLDVHKAPFRNDKGEIIGVVGSARDVTEKKLAEEKLQLASLVLHNSSEALMVTDKDNLIVDINPAFTKLTGYSEDEAIGKNPNILRSARHDHDFYSALWSALELTGQWQGEIWNRRKDGEMYAAWMTINTIHNDEGSIHRRVSLFSDITEKKNSEELIWTQANFDYLTKLPNRRMFRDRLSQDIKKAHRGNSKLALLFLDLDRFKEINDTLGHDLGDMLLVEAAQRISACIRESDTVARLGGDEFTIILTELEETSSVDRIADDIIQALNQPFKLIDDNVYVSASIGITLYPDDSTEIEDLLKNADQAMFVSKRSGRNRFSYFTTAMQQAAQHRLHLLNDLRVALAKKQFKLHYQPIVEFNTGRIHKAEALLRWFHPERGIINPAEFIPLAEESGLIHELGDWVFSEAAKQALLWRSLYGQDFQISVNISPIQIQSTDNHAHWLHQLEKQGLLGQNLVFEITEGLLLDMTPNVTAQLLSFRDAGIQVAIDDFGTGYSALSYLKKMDIDYLKIDQSFIRNLAPESSDMALCEAIVVMAHKLGLKVIAEGVETTEQNTLLAGIGCDCVQGYFHSRPLPAEQIEKLLVQERSRRSAD